MSAQTTRRSIAAVREDCRDYLRTGRCKYGASCKYQHPLNVQSGGGMKAPLDPNEPLFPVRPNEPLCQYYMKHGTCKFGQACKFNHPLHTAGGDAAAHGSSSAGLGIANTNAASGNANSPNGSSSSTLGANNVSSNNNSNNNSTNNNPATAFITVNNRKHDHWGSDSGVQILPQRPDEPNCMYFLKNGRCKYGATCRFHHPIHAIQDTSNNARSNVATSANNNVHANRRQQQHPIHVQQLPTLSSSSPTSADAAPKVHYVTSIPANYQQSRFVVSNGSASFVSLDGGNNPPASVIAMPKSAPGGNIENHHQQQQHGQQQQQLQANIVHNGHPSPQAVGKSLGLSREVASSTSSTSIASSYDTMGSSGEAFTTYGGDSSSSLWTSRPSNNSIAANSAGMVHGSNDGTSSSTNTGGADNHSSSVHHHEPSQGSSPITSIASNPAANAWGRGRRSASFDHTRSRVSSQIHKSSSVPEFGVVDNDDSDYGYHHGDGDALLRSSKARHGAPARHSRRSGQSQRGRRDEDEGLSRMTSALLTMLDTTEEISFEEGYENDSENFYEDSHNASSQPPTPVMRPRYPSSPGTAASPSRHHSGGQQFLHSQQQPQQQHHNANPQHQFEDDDYHTSNRGNGTQNLYGSYDANTEANNRLSESIGGQYLHQQQQYQSHRSNSYQPHQQKSYNEQQHYLQSQKLAPHAASRTLSGSFPYSSHHSPYASSAGDDDMGWTPSWQHATASRTISKASSFGDQYTPEAHPSDRGQAHGLHHHHPYSHHHHGSTRGAASDASSSHVGLYLS